MRGSRTTAPRRVSRLCRLWVAFSAMQRARWSGKEKFISTGHSVPGVIWNRMRMPSTISSWPVWVISRVGAMSPMVPSEVVCPQPGPDLAGRTFRQCGAVHVDRPAGHGGTGVDVLGDRRLHEAVAGDDRHLGFVDPVHPTKVVTVGVGVDDRGHRPLAPVLAVEGEGGRSALGRDQRVDDDDPVVGLDQRHVREVQAPHLIDPVGHLVEALLGLSWDWRHRLGLTVSGHGPSKKA